MRQDLHSTIQILALRAEGDHVDAQAGRGHEFEQSREVAAAKVAGDAAREALAGQEEAIGHVRPLVPRPRPSSARCDLRGA